MVILWRQACSTPDLGSKMTQKFPKANNPWCSHHTKAKAKLNAVNICVLHCHIIHLWCTKVRKNAEIFEGSFNKDAILKAGYPGFNIVYPVQILTPHFICSLSSLWEGQLIWPGDFLITCAVLSWVLLTQYGFSSARFPVWYRNDSIKCHR